jgi:hypothetical protein
MAGDRTSRKSSHHKGIPWRCGRLPGRVWSARSFPQCRVNEVGPDGLVNEPVRIAGLKGFVCRPVYRLPEEPAALRWGVVKRGLLRSRHIGPQIIHAVASLRLGRPANDTASGFFSRGGC